jgi:hypothetical protein
VTKVADKTTAVVGDKITYTVAVKNIGDTALDVTPADAGCDTDLLPTAVFALAPGETKTFTCSHVATAADATAGSYTNQACATGVDKIGGTVSDCASVITNPITTPPTTPTTPLNPATPPAGQIVLGQRITPGSARLFGRTGCVSSAFNARVRGAQVARVVFTLDGKVVGRITKPNRAGDFAVRISPAKLRIGVHRVVATVTFKAASRTKAKTLRLSFQRCGRRLAVPRFTG